MSPSGIGVIFDGRLLITNSISLLSWSGFPFLCDSRLTGMCCQELVHFFCMVKMLNLFVWISYCILILFINSFSLTYCSIVYPLYFFQWTNVFLLVFCIFNFISFFFCQTFIIYFFLLNCSLFSGFLGMYIIR